MMITDTEKKTAQHCLEYALAQGAAQCRITLNKNVLDSFQILDGKLDKVSHCADRSIFLCLFVDGRYGTYSTNRLDSADLEDFIAKAVESTRMTAVDEFRMLPSPERTEKNAVSGREMGLYDPEYEAMTAQRRLSLALSGSIFDSAPSSGSYTLISEECEYSDSVDDIYIIDSNGFEGRHTETSFSYTSEITVQDRRGHKYSGYKWTSSPHFSKIDIESCGRKALDKAASQINPRKFRSGKMTMVVDCMSSSRLVAPVLSALNASAIQQKNSFLEDSLGKKIFSEHFSIIDMARAAGQSGARMFDSEGVATKEMPIIENGIVRTYFVGTYMAGKTGLAPTIEGVSVPVVMPFINASSQQEITQEDILKACGDGILVTSFNGGNCNPTTGNFSYGVEGFVFRHGRIVHPVREMVVTGNMTTLWNSLVAAGTDAANGARWQIPTLAFSDVDFSA